MAGTCCCYVPIRYGVITIAVLGILAGLFAVIPGIFFIAMHWINGNWGLYLYDREFGHSPYSLVIKLRGSLRFILGLSIGFVILGVIHIITCIVLLVGVTGGKPNFVKVWVWVGIVTLVIFALGLLIAGIISMVYGLWVIAFFPASFFLVVAVPWAFDEDKQPKHSSTEKDNHRKKSFPEEDN